MNDLIFVFLTIFIVTGMIYFLYKIMLGSEKDNKDEELQITSQELLQQINILYRQKKYNIVENLAKKYLEKKPADDDIRTVFAKSLYDSQKIYDAIDQAKIILKHKPQNFDMKVFISNCYVGVEKPMKAVTILQEILETDPNNVVAIKELAHIYYKTNQKLSSIKMYKKLEEFLDSNQEKAKNKALVAEMHVYFKEFDLAIKEYEEILGIYPEEINVRKRLIELYKLTSDYEALIELATEVIKTSDSANALWAMNAIMDAYRITQNYEKALEFANLIKEHPLSNEIQSGENIAQIFLEEGKIDSSIEMLKSLIEKDPKNVELKKSLARSYEANENFELATELYRKILDNANAQDIEQIHFEMSNIYSNWAIHLFLQNDNSECFKHFIIALKYGPKNPDIYYRLGNVNKLIKSFNESISQYKKAIELDNQNPDYYYAISECYEAIDSIYEQKKALIEYLKYNSNSAKVYYKLGVIYSTQNDLTNAMSHIKKAIELDENFVEPKYKLALMLEHAGDKEGAITLYEDILRLTPENEEIANNLRMLRAR